MKNNNCTKKVEDKKIIFLITSILHSHNINIKEELDSTITKGEIPFLILLYRKGNKTQQEIAEEFCFTESNVAKTIRKLEDKKLIIRQVDQNNRRKKIVSLTEAGIKKSEEIITIEEKWEENVTKNLNEKEKELLKRLLNEIQLESIKLRKN